MFRRAGSISEIIHSGEQTQTKVYPISHDSKEPINICPITKKYNTGTKEILKRIQKEVKKLELEHH